MQFNFLEKVYTQNVHTNYKLLTISRGDFLPWELFTLPLPTPHLVEKRQTKIIYMIFCIGSFFLSPGHFQISWKSRTTWPFKDSFFWNVFLMVICDSLKWYHFLEKYVSQLSPFYACFQMSCPSMDCPSGKMKYKFFLRFYVLYIEKKNMQF